MVKLVIWDLDDTLWAGTLAEGDAVEPHGDRVAAIRELNRRGVVNAICSKNDPEVAKAKLVELGLWDDFVFPVIRFLPKGELVRQLLQDMQLRAPDVAFIDDNPVNLGEVAHFNPGIRVIDAREDACDAFLRELVESLQGVNKSRVEQYRMLERKIGDREASAGSNEEFLASCGIRMALVRRTDNLAFASRIEELVNRTNQLNFTKSRVAAGSIPEYVIDVATNETYSVFVWDRYGDYGLVGFAAVERKVLLKHFLFSCRTMNMGVENAVAFVLSKTFRGMKLPVDAKMPPWITLVQPEDEEFKSVLARLGVEDGEPRVRVMANCQSGAIAHYMATPGTRFDNWPRVFKLEDVLAGNLPCEARMLVYGAFNDYDHRYWTAPPSQQTFEDACLALARHVESRDGILAVILPPEVFEDERPKQGVTQARFAALNRIWRRVADRHASVRLVDLSDARYGCATADPRHFDRDCLMRIGMECRALVDAADSPAGP